MQINQLKNIHFIGIGGNGISAAAQWMLKLGKNVSGSDLIKSDATLNLSRLGAQIQYGHKKENLKPEVQLVVYSDAVNEDNPERLEAKSKNIRQLNSFSFLSKLFKNIRLIAVSGTNGKTTASAMMGKALADLKTDPLVFIGGKLKEFKGNFRYGGAWAVLEADEYKAHMLEFWPWSVILTSIEADHLDFYKNLESIIEHFQKFIDRVPPNGYVFYPADDQNIGKLKLPAKSFSCSLTNNEADYYAKNIEFNNSAYDYEVFFREQSLGKFHLKFPGRYNILNSLLTIAFCHQNKLDLEKLKVSLADFGGLWRRLEILGNYKNKKDVLALSDYTHHPEAIAKTLEAAREFYPKRRLFLVYQPHQHDRTKKLYGQFLKCFKSADLVVLNEIYDVAGRKYQDDDKISSRQLADEIKQSQGQEIRFAADFKQTEKLIQKLAKPGDLLLLMGAGDIDAWARKKLI